MYGKSLQYRSVVLNFRRLKKNCMNCLSLKHDVKFFMRASSKNNWKEVIFLINANFITFFIKFTQKLPFLHDQYNKSIL